MDCWYYHTKKSQKGSYFPLFFQLGQQLPIRAEGKFIFMREHEVLN